MKFENILAETDGFGRYQVALFLLLAIPRIILPCHFMLNNFIGVTPPHHCDFSTLDPQGTFGTLTPEQRLTISIPKQHDGHFLSCQMFPEAQFQLLVNSSNSTGLPVVRCQDGWVYDNSTFTSTLATQVTFYQFNSG